MLPLPWEHVTWTRESSSHVWPALPNCHFTSKNIKRRLVSSLRLSSEYLRMAYCQSLEKIPSSTGYGLLSRSHH